MTHIALKQEPLPGDVVSGLPWLNPLFEGVTLTVSPGKWLKLDDFPNPTESIFENNLLFFIIVRLGFCTSGPVNHGFQWSQGDSDLKPGKTGRFPGAPGMVSCVVSFEQQPVI
ncbi:hypothetical protein KKI24_11795, partial [bacterium]|nr:hypothetical protein [bacterium]